MKVNIERLILYGMIIFLAISSFHEYTHISADKAEVKNICIMGIYPEMETVAWVNYFGDVEVKKYPDEMPALIAEAFMVGCLMTLCMIYGRVFKND